MNTAPATDAAHLTRLRRQWTRSEVLRDRRFYMAMPACLAPSFFFTGFFFHQVHLVAAKGWELSWWGSWFAAYAFASLLATHGVFVGPGALFEMPGYFRLSLTANDDMVTRALPVFEFARELAAG